MRVEAPLLHMLFSESNCIVKWKMCGWAFKDTMRKAFGRIVFAKNVDNRMSQIVSDLVEFQQSTEFFLGFGVTEIINIPVLLCIGSLCFCTFFNCPFSDKLQ